MDGAAFEKFLQDKFKLEGGKPGQLGDKVKIAREGAFRLSRLTKRTLTLRTGDARIVVSGNLPISKRYLKYLTKKVRPLYIADDPACSMEAHST